MVGGNKPDLRLSDSGKLMDGIGSTGTPMKLSTRRLGLAYFFFVVDADAGGA
jgi:hypothetical protein